MGMTENAKEPRDCVPFARCTGGGIQRTDSYEVTPMRVKKLGSRAAVRALCLGCIHDD